MTGLDHQGVIAMLRLASVIVILTMETVTVAPALLGITTTLVVNVSLYSLTLVHDIFIIILLWYIIMMFYNYVIIIIYFLF